MTYQTQQIKPVHFPKIKAIPIAKQKQVIEETGQPFEPIKALQAIRDASKEYSLEDATALEVDRMMMDWLNQNGFSVVDPAPKPQKKQERQPTKQDYIDAIEGFKIMLEFTSGEEKQQYEDAIVGFQIMVDLL